MYMGLRPVSIMYEDRPTLDVLSHSVILLFVSRRLFLSCFLYTACLMLKCPGCVLLSPNSLLPIDQSELMTNSNVEFILLHSYTPTQVITTAFILLY